MDRNTAVTNTVPDAEPGDTYAASNRLWNADAISNPNRNSIRYPDAHAFRDADAYAVCNANSNAVTDSDPNSVVRLQ